MDNARPEEVEAEETPLEEAPVVQQKLGLTALVSSLLFVSTKPMSAERLARAAEIRVERIEKALAELQGLLNDEVHGFSLTEVAGGWQLRSAPGAAQAIRRLVPPKTRRLSRASAETLAIIAYKQPVERAEIESIRGVDALPTLKTLLDGKLIQVVGKQDAIGQPALYGTTKRFLEKFGLRDLSDLPSLREFEELLEDPGEDSSSDLDDDFDDSLEEDFEEPAEL